MTVDPSDEAAIEAQLGRPPRGIRDIGHRCPCGNPDVVTTEPRLPDGTPFPTTFYLTCPRVASLIGTLEGSGLMQEMTDRLGADPVLAAGYQAAHESYLSHRESLGHVPEIAGISAGGMPTRVKCLHVLAAHSLAAGPGVNPLGDEVLELLGPWWAEGPCVPRPSGAEGLDEQARVWRAENPQPRPRGAVRVGAVDCGTNTIKLLVADLDPGTGQTHELVRAVRMVRLGQDVDRTGRLADEALERTFRAIDEYAEILADFELDGLRFCATSAARDASNAEDFAAGVERRLGVGPEVVSGAEEAALSFDGATRELPGLPAPVVVLDIGGGSTELIVGAGHGAPALGRSLDIGSVRLTERHLRSDPPTPAEIAAAVAQIDEALDTLDGLGVEGAASMVGVAGTVTTVAAMVLDLPTYDRERIHHAELAVDDVHAAVERLVGMSVAERRRLPFLHPGRADVIGAGALILDRVLRRLGPGVTSIRISESDILDGIAWSLLPTRQPGPTPDGVSYPK